MTSSEVKTMASAIKKQLNANYAQNEIVRNRYNELKRRDYYKTVRTVCFCSNNPKDSEFAQSILAKRYFHGKAKAADQVILPLLASFVGKPQEDVYEERDSYQCFWDSFAQKLSSVEPDFVFLNVLSESPVIGGLRSRDELRHGVSKGFISCSVWIESDSKPVTNRVKRSDHAITRRDCDFMISKGRTLIGQVRKIETLGNLLYSGIS